MTTADERLAAELSRVPLAVPLQRRQIRLTPRRPRWERRYKRTLPLVDALVVLTALAGGETLQQNATGTWPSSPVVHVLVLAIAWVLALGLNGSWSVRTLGQGADEYRRVVRGTWHIAVLYTALTALTHAALPTGLALLSVPTGLAGLLGARHILRRRLWLRRSQGEAKHRLLVVGPAKPAADLIDAFTGHASAFEVVGLCIGGLLGDHGQMTVPDLTSLHELEDVLEALTRTRADTVAVVGEFGMPEGFVRRLSWRLEGTGINLVLPSSIDGLINPRMRVRPIAGLQPHYVGQAMHHAASRHVKAALDSILSGLLLIVLSPLMLLIALAIKGSSRGPVMFRQRRIGLNGRYFQIWKYRTMLDGSDTMHGLAAELAGGRGKALQDPRVTPVGRFLRRTSLDELPQLLNVLLGNMSLVGPRPVPASLDTFAEHELRRLAVKPGMTGLWQVSGRSDLSWPERVHLDTYYVDNWSHTLDLTILFRTISVVVRGDGAY